MHCVRFADRVGACFGKAEMLHLTLLYEVRHRSCDLFDRHLGIDAVPIVRIDRIGRF
jgi:hypothetical protein